VCAWCWPAAQLTPSRAFSTHVASHASHAEHAACRVHTALTQTHWADWLLSWPSSASGLRTTLLWVQECSWWRPDSEDEDEPAGLPAGPWPSLHRLEVGWDTMVLSRAVLPTLRQLDHLVIHGTPPLASDAEKEVWDA